MRSKLFTKLKEFQDTDRWVKLNLNSLELIPVAGISVAGIEDKEFLLSKDKAISKFKDLNLENKKNILSCSFLLKSNLGYFAVSSNALTSINHRAENNSIILNRLLANDKAKYAKMLNMSWEYQVKNDEGTKISKEGLALVREGTLLAVHSERYAMLEQYDLLSYLDSYISTKFHDATIEDFYVDNYKTIVQYSLASHTDSILDTYVKALKDTNSNDLALLDKTKASVSFFTSDTGQYRVTFMPKLIVDNVSYPIGSPLRFKHSGNKSVEEIKKGLAGLFSKMEINFDKLAAMAKIKIDYPSSVLVRALKEMGLGEKHKKAAKLLIEAKRNELNSKAGTISALDIYKEIATFVNNSNELRQAKTFDIIRIEEDLARLITIFDWNKANVNSDEKI